MTAGTRQYESANTTTTTMSGNADLTITAASDKLQIIDPGGSARNLDLVFVDSSGSDVTTGFAEVYIQNEADADETITVRDGNNSDNAIGIVDQNNGAWFRWVGTGTASTSRWVTSSSGEKN